MDSRLKAVLLSGGSSAEVRKQIADEAAAVIASDRNERQASLARISADAERLSRAAHDELDTATAPLVTTIEELTDALHPY